MLFGGDRLHVNTSEIFVSFERVLSLSFKILSCVILLLLLYVYILVRALPNIGGSYLLHCRSIWFYALGFTEYYLLAILDVLNLHERRFGGHFFSNKCFIIFNTDICIKKVDVSLGYFIFRLDGIVFFHSSYSKNLWIVL